MGAPTLQDYLNFSAMVYTKATDALPTPPVGWSILINQKGELMYTIDPDTGLQAMASINNTTHEIMVSVEGSNLNNATSTNATNLTFAKNQLVDDYAIMHGASVPSNIPAVTFLNKVSQAVNGNPIYLAGHSKTGDPCS